MNTKYKFQNIPVGDLLLNQNNARFFSGEELNDEIESINEMLLLGDSYIVELAVDIAKNGLLSNDLPICKPLDNGSFLVLEGNRRITAIKLMTTYKNSLDSFKIKQNEKSILQNLECNIVDILAVVSTDIEYINSLLERTHTAKKGISRVTWNALAADNFRDSQGKTSKRKIILELVLNSNYASERISEIIKQKGWISIFARFINNDKYLLKYFGLKFENDNSVYLLWNEKITVERLNRLIVDAFEKKASEMAQNDKLMLKYANDTIRNVNNTNPQEYNDPVISFDYSEKKFKVTNITNELAVSKDDNSSHYNNDKTKDGSNYNNSNRLNDPTNQDDIQSNNIPKEDSLDVAKEDIKNTNDSKNLKYKSTKSKTVIPLGDNLVISDIRTNELYNELMRLNATTFINVAAISLRSLFEFSINCYLTKIKGSYPQNDKLFERLIKVCDNLNGKGLRTELKKKSPYVDTLYEKHKSGDKTVSINTLNLYVHHSNFHPNLHELQTEYNNFKGFLSIIWNEIDKK